jgi:hypothetical protein
MQGTHFGDAQVPNGHICIVSAAAVRRSKRMRTAVVLAEICNRLVVRAISADLNHLRTACIELWPAQSWSVTPSISAVVVATEGTHTCMGRFLSRRFPKGPVHCLVPYRFFVRSGSFFVRSGKPFLRPRVELPARAGAVNGWPPLAATERLGLDGSEHDGTVAEVGMTDVRGEPRVCARISVPHTCMRWVAETRTMMQ